MLQNMWAPCGRRCARIRRLERGALLSHCDWRRVVARGGDPPLTTHARAAGCVRWVPVYHVFHTHAVMGGPVVGVVGVGPQRIHRAA